jgi:hypothetical protein
MICRKVVEWYKVIDGLKTTVQLILISLEMNIRRILLVQNEGMIGQIPFA